MWLVRDGQATVPLQDDWPEHDDSKQCVYVYTQDQNKLYIVLLGHRGKSDRSLVRTAAGNPL
jgi:hypothetical protein